jgi:hypothetical protein
MRAPGSPQWTATGGTLTIGASVVWTAPADGATCTIKATPAKGTPASVSMEVIPPDSRVLYPWVDRVYDPGRAGSGFKADVTIMPLDVSFARTEVWEGAATAVATGYYDTTLGANGKRHLPTQPVVPPRPRTSAIIRDTVGTDPPGSPGPFSPGTFEWAIPQLHRPAGGSGARVYSTPHQLQMMIGNKGTEGTAKEGAVRTRRL